MKNKNYIMGILGGIVGGLIAAIPWIVIYVYGNYLLSILATLIAFGIAYGYKLLKGPINKKYPIIITVLSLLIVTFVTMVVIPLLLLKNENYDVSLTNLKILYESKEFISAVVKDLIISIIFTFLGISGVVSKAKQEILNS